MDAWLDIKETPPPGDRLVVVTGPDAPWPVMAIWDGSRNWHTRDPNTGKLKNILKWEPTLWRP